MADITLTQAQQAVDAALNKANEMGVKMDIAVVDVGANLKTFARMDGAWLGSIDIAQKKARTARWFDMPTGSIGGLPQPCSWPRSFTPPLPTPCSCIAWALCS